MNRQERELIKYSTLFLESLEAVNNALRKSNEGMIWEHLEEQEKLQLSATKEQEGIET